MRRATDLGAATLQIFTGSPRLWPRAELDAVEVRKFRAAREAAGLWPLAVHDSYLINLASADPGLRRRSLRALRLEIRHARRLGAEYLVLHPGSHRGLSLEEGLRAVADSLARATRGLKSDGLVLLLENTAGAGASLGARFEELEAIRQMAQARVEFEIGFCLDTAHCFAAGYDVATTQGLRATLQQADRVLGLDRVKLIHANDSRATLGSRRDRHEHIGRGAIGLAGFRRMVNHPRLSRLPFILETPRASDADDRRNLQTLKDLCRRKTTTRSNWK
ncbi:MAG: deoxyribonuclease IV [Bryobacteraceae bacterium]